MYNIKNKNCTIQQRYSFILKIHRSCYEHIKCRPIFVLDKNDLFTYFIFSLKIPNKYAFY